MKKLISAFLFFGMMFSAQAEIEKPNFKNLGMAFLDSKRPDLRKLSNTLWHGECFYHFTDYPTNVKSSAKLEITREKNKYNMKFTTEFEHSSPDVVKGEIGVYTDAIELKQDNPNMFKSAFASYVFYMNDVFDFWMGKPNFDDSDMDSPLQIKQNSEFLFVQHYMNEDFSMRCYLIQ